jgi:hypothetical protein
VEAADEGGHDVAVVWMEVIAWPVKIGRHDRAVIHAVLSVVALTQLDARNFCYGVGLFRWLQSAREQGVLAHRLWHGLGIDA